MRDVISRGKDHLRVEMELGDTGRVRPATAGGDHRRRGLQP